MISILIGLVACVQAAVPTPPAGASAEPPFDVRRAEHLLGRAGFGVNTAEVNAAAERGLRHTLRLLLEPVARAVVPFEPENFAYSGTLGAQRLPPAEAESGAEPGDQGEMGEAEESDADAAEEARAAERRKLQAQLRRDDAAQLAEYTAEWLAGMVRGDDPLRDRMTLFWHGHFTSSMQDVRSSHAMIRQHQLLRAGALGSFRDLLTGILRDPAMLVYLDNHRNRRGNPNENLARELFELFTLGEGHFTEDDVKEAARALTGRAAFRGEYVFTPRRHDNGQKTILGKTGRFDGDDLVEILLDHPRTALTIAEELLTWFEGVAPTPDRVARYAAQLRASDWQITPLLATLFEDPDFYRDDVRGARVAGPLDFLVGAARRLGVEPPDRALDLGARNLGERLFFPPSVKGWDGGETWITTSSLLARGNLAGMLTGSIGIAELLGADLEADSMEAESVDGNEAPRRPRARRAPRLGNPELRELAGRDQGLRELGRMGRSGWNPKLDLAQRLDAAKATTDAAAIEVLMEDLLAIPPPAETRAELIGFLAEQRAEFSVPEDRLASWGADGEQLLRRMAHRILSLPEAQLH